MCQMEEYIKYIIKKILIILFNHSLFKNREFKKKTV